MIYFLCELLVFIILLRSWRNNNKCYKDTQIKTNPLIQWPTLVYDKNFPGFQNGMLQRKKNRWVLDKNRGKMVIMAVKKAKIVKSKSPFQNTRTFGNGPFSFPWFKATLFMATYFSSPNRMIIQIIRFQRHMSMIRRDSYSSNSFVAGNDPIQCSRLP